MRSFAMTILIGFGFLLLMSPLTSCASKINDEPLYVACRDLIQKERTLRPYKVRMSQQQLSIVQNAVKLASETCLRPAREIRDMKAAVNDVKDHIKTLEKVEGELP